MDRPITIVQAESQLTGAHDTDLRILFELSDSDLLRACRLNSYFQLLCNSPEAKAWWQDRYRRNFPYLPNPPGGWREGYINALVTSQLSREKEKELNAQFTTTHNSFPCIANYLTTLSRQAYAFIDQIGVDAAYDVIINPQDWQSSMGEPVKSFLLRYHNPPYTRDELVEAIIGRVLWLSGDISGRGYTNMLPWNINRIIGNERLLMQIFPEVNTPIVVTVSIGDKRGYHSLTEEQFLGMTLYSVYMASHRVKFIISGCLFNLNVDDLGKYIKVKRLMVGRRYTITMNNDDQFYFYTMEFMRGFITMARWLGENYRLGYRTVISYPGY